MTEHVDTQQIDDDSSRLPGYNRAMFSSDTDTTFNNLHKDGFNRHFEPCGYNLDVLLADILNNPSNESGYDLDMLLADILNNPSNESGYDLDMLLDNPSNESTIYDAHGHNPTLPDDHEIQSRTDIDPACYMNPLSHDQPIT